MSANTNLAIRIASIFDNKGLKNAEKGIKGLQGSVKKLAGAAGIGLSTASAINFGKNAVKAFAENEKSAKRLAGVVRNLGLSFETPLIEKNLDSISAKFGYQGEVLRDAYQKLIGATGSVTKSNDLLNLSLDVSAGSSVDLVTVNQDLAAAYLGNTKGLGKYNLGLTKSELKTLKFDDAVSLLAKNFKGAGENELETFSGKMRVLGEAADTAQENIGKGLVDALSLLSGEGNTIQPLADSMADFGTYVGDAILGTGLLIDKLNNIPGVGNGNAVSKNSFFMFPSTGALAILKKGLDYVSKTGAEYSALINPTTQGYLGSMPVGIYPTPAQIAARKKADADAAKRQKDIARSQTKQLEDARKKAALEKASKTLNLDLIGIEAALKGSISETDRISLQLQKALINGNSVLATQLSDQLEAAIKRNNELRLALLTTPKAPNPYADWKVPADLLSYTATVLGVSPETVINAPQTIPVPTEDPLREIFDAVIAAQVAQDKADAAARAADAIAAVVNVKVEVAGEEVAAVITQQQTNKSLSGSFVGVNRTARFGTRVDEG